MLFLLFLSSLLAGGTCTSRRMTSASSPSWASRCCVPGRGVVAGRGPQGRSGGENAKELLKCEPSGLPEKLSPREEHRAGTGGASSTGAALSNDPQLGPWNSPADGWPLPYKWSRRVSRAWLALPLGTLTIKDVSRLWRSALEIRAETPDTCAETSGAEWCSQLLERLPQSRDLLARPPKHAGQKEPADFPRHQVPSAA